MQLKMTYAYSMIHHTYIHVMCTKRYLHVYLHVYTTKKNSTIATMVKKMIKQITLLLFVFNNFCMPPITLSILVCTVCISLPNSSNNIFCSSNSSPIATAYVFSVSTLFVMPSIMSSCIFRCSC